ncbi:MAG TPA: EAL domain-containing protein [Gammaproteobacteria bacterium]|nr:EAL domain-containing protein [Gammaproteobacteria bacterium]
MDLTSILWFSVLLQVFAAIMALRLIPFTGKAIAWIILSMAFILMASRRAISLLRQEGIVDGEWLTAMTTEIVALVISLLIVVGVFMIRGVFLKKTLDEDELRKLSQVVEQTSSSTIITDLEGNIEYVNQKFTEITGYELDEIKGKPTNFLNSGKTRPEVFVNMWKTIQAGRVWIGEFCNECKNGTLRWEKARVSPVRDGEEKITHYVAVLEDVTEQRAQREALEYMAMHDSLTDLPNRALFYDRVYQAILGAEHNKSSVAVLLMDLNHFKVINDTLGHHIGDQILKEVANRLLRTVKTYDTVARMGGDEFLVLLSDVQHEQASRIAKRLSEAVQEPFVIAGHNFDIDMSIGIAMYPQNGDDPDVLIQRSDVAMYSAKSRSTGIAMYDPDLDDYSVGRLELLGEVRNALEAEQFCVHYQPRMDLFTMEMEGVEALVRWMHPKRGIIYPDNFIPILEETGHITVLTRWIIKKAIEQLALWRNLNPEFIMSINISTRDLCDQKLSEYIAENLKFFDVPPSAIILEITESSLMQYSRYTYSTIDSLDELGIKLAIDDFGTGYSSLQYLKVLPVSELKIDKSFVMNMLDDEDDAVIVRSTIDLGHNLGLDVVAEGVEDEETSKILQILNCNHAQGYHFSKAVEEGVITKMITGENNIFKLQNEEEINNSQVS